MIGAARLTGTVKHYDWGGISFVPSLLNISNKEKKPFAEYWLGVHPQAECMVELDKSRTPLPSIIKQYGAEALGEKVFKSFGTIPYLLKALDVKDMLSIQVHPSRSEAIKDFERANTSGIPIDSAQRNYKDANHKPELMVAMGKFWLLHGFKPELELKKTLQTVTELNSLLAIFETTGYAGLYRKVMEMAQDEVNAQLQPLLDRLVPLYKKDQLDKGSADYWAAKAALTFSKAGKTDRGIYSIYFFNLVELSRGEAIFQDAGVPHAYLEGQNIEIMASSDNVLRGGLTTKHIDVPELLKHVKCEATHPRILEGMKRSIEIVYQTSAPDFELSRFDLPANATTSFTATTAEILLMTGGAVDIVNGPNKIRLQKGHPSAIVFAGERILLHAHEPSLVFRATVPVNKGE